MLSNVHKIESAHHQSVISYCAKFEYKVMKTVGVTYYTQIIQSKYPKGGADVIMSKFNTLKNIPKIVHKIECA